MFTSISNTVIDNIRTSLKFWDVLMSWHMLKSIILTIESKYLWLFYIIKKRDAM